MYKILALTTILALAGSTAFSQYTPLTREDETLFAAGTVGGSSTAVNYRGQEVTSVITLGGIAETLKNAADGESQILYTFPEGRIQIIAAACDIVVGVETGVFENTANDVFYFGIGTTAAAVDATLATTEQDIIAVQTLDVEASGGDGGSVSSFTNQLDMTAGGDWVFDGTAAAKSVYLNFAVAAASLSATCDLTATGTLTITWLFLGDD